MFVSPVPGGLCCRYVYFVGEFFPFFLGRFVYFFGLSLYGLGGGRGISIG